MWVRRPGRGQALLATTVHARAPEGAGPAEKQRHGWWRLALVGGGCGRTLGFLLAGTEVGRGRPGALPEVAVLRHDAARPAKVESPHQFLGPKCTPDGL